MPQKPDVAKFNGLTNKELKKINILNKMKAHLTSKIDAKRKLVKNLRLKK